MRNTIPTIQYKLQSPVLTRKPSKLAAEISDGLYTGQEISNLISEQYFENENQYKAVLKAVKSETEKAKETLFLFRNYEAKRRRWALIVQRWQAALDKLEGLKDRLEFRVECNVCGESDYGRKTELTVCGWTFGTGWSVCWKHPQPKN